MSFMTDPDYTMKITTSWMTLDYLEGERMIRYFMYISGMK